MPRASIKVRKDGRYKVKYKGIQFYGSTQSEAMAKRAEYIRLEQAGYNPTVHEYIFSEWVGKWLAAYKSGCQTKQYNQHVVMMQYAITFMKDPPVKNITSADVATLYTSIGGKSKSYITKFTADVKSCLQAAVRDGIIIRNPADGLAKPDGHAGSHRALTADEIRLTGELQDHRMGLAAMAMLYAGLRRGEALYLNIDRDIDFKAEIIHVRGAVAFPDDNQPEESSGKTYNAIREIPLLEPLSIALKDKHGLLVSKKNGELLSSSSFRRVWESWKAEYEAKVNGTKHGYYLRRCEKLREKGVKEEDLPKWIPCSIRTHDFRHTFCSFCYEAGVDMKTAQEWMGHSDATMIMEIYAHLSNQKRRESAMKLKDKVSDVSKVFGSGSGVQNGVQNDS